MRDRIDRVKAKGAVKEQAVMSVMLSKTYRALVSAGASPDEAREASEEIAGFDKRLVRLEVMVAMILAGVVSLVVKAFA